VNVSYKIEDSLFFTSGSKDSFGNYIASWKDDDYRIMLSITMATVTNLSVDGDSELNEIGYLIYVLPSKDIGNENSNPNPF